jgi:hypothetical protein
MRLVLALAICLFPGIALGGFPNEGTLEEMAASADHVLLGRVTGVDMIDGQGNLLTDLDARTGPGLNNSIRLLIAVDEVLATNAAQVPKQLALPLGRHLHYRLGQILDAHAGDSSVRLILLKGSDFSGIKEGLFFRPLADKEKALEIYRAKRR